MSAIIRVAEKSALLRARFARFLCFAALALAPGVSVSAGEFVSPRGYRLECPDDWQFFTTTDMSQIKDMDPRLNEWLAANMAKKMEAGLWTRTGPLSDAIIAIHSWKNDRIIRPENFEEILADIRSIFSVWEYDGGRIMNFDGHIVSRGDLHYIACDFNVREQSGALLEYVPVSARCFANNRVAVLIYGTNYRGNQKAVDSTIDRIARSFEFESLSLSAAARENLDLIIAFGGAGATLILVGLMVVFSQTKKQPAGAATYR